MGLRGNPPGPPTIIEPACREGAPCGRLLLGGREHMGIRVGIDLGTTFSAVARIHPGSGTPEIIKNSFGSAATPSVLCFQPDGTVLFGEDAKSMQSVGDTNAVAFFKRSMGKDFFSVDILGRAYTATDLSAILLRGLKEEAEARIQEKIDAAVVTVPAYFTHKERAATMEAGKRAGLDVIAIINEPTAAALAYGLNESRGRQTVLIYDLGGGTFDVTLASIRQDAIDILGSDGNHELGGKDWDDCVARYLASEFLERYGVDVSQDAEAVASLLVTAENVKKQLTSRDSVTVPLAFGGVRGTVEITEETFESISSFLVGATKDVTERLLDAVGMGWPQIDGVILVGGSTRMRMIHSYVREMCGKEPLHGVNVDEAVALGAAIRANITGKGEAVAALGGAKRAQAMPSIAGAKAVTDVTAHALGMIAVSTDGERYVNSTIIKKNTRIPAGNTRPFHLRTRRGNNELEVYVLQGDCSRPLDNTIINKYVISGIEATGGPEATIDVTYRYTSNGVVEVSAAQQETRRSLPVKIEPVPEDMSWTDLSPKENQGSGAGMPSIDVILMIDLSGSMYTEPLRRAKAAMHDFVERMDSSCTRVGLGGFADRTRISLNPTDDYQRVHRHIDQIDGLEVGGATSAEPIAPSFRTLTGRHCQGDIKYLVILTDGQWSKDSQAIAAARLCHKAGIEIMALGFGDADYDFLRKIASTDGFAAVTSLAELGGSFSKIAQAIGEGSTGLAVR